VRLVGDLADTVFDAYNSDKPFEQRGGNPFDDLTASAQRIGNELCHRPVFQLAGIFPPVEVQPGRRLLRENHAPVFTLLSRYTGRDYLQKQGGAMDGEGQECKHRRTLRYYG